MIIREERDADIQGIRDINIAAFNGETEADIVDALRVSGALLISLVAEDDGILVGHIAFSPVTLDGCDRDISIVALAPMSVLPEYQRQGVGSELVEEGLNRCEDAGYDAVVVLGYPEYYPRFGFVPSVEFNITSEYDVPDEVFMVLELNTGSLTDCTGTIKYDDAFNIDDA